MNPLEQLFEDFWSRTVPVMFRSNPKLRMQGRQAFNQLLSELSRHAAAPEGARTLAAMLKIGRILREAKIIIEDPNPDPDAIAAAVQSLIDRLKVPEGAD